MTSLPPTAAPSGIAPGGDAHHSVPAHEVVLLLGTDVESGLTAHEAASRLARYGHNVLPAGRSAGPLVRFARQFHHPLIYILLAASAVMLLLGETVDSAVVFGVVLINAIVGFIQESKAEAALDALRSMIRTEARVRRDGSQRTVPSEDLVPGDVVLVEAGDKVPVDLRLVELAELQVDESALTGESVPVAKDEVALPVSTPVADRHNMVYSGTLVTHGTGVGVAVATGSGTELGEIHRLVGTADDLDTPLTRKLARFSKILTVVILALAGVTFAAGVLRGENADEMFTAAVALAVGAIPEGLPAAVTVTLAIGVNRMARRRAVIRRMPAVETLGSTTVVCSDKTGTLTENQMTVRVVWTADETFEVTGSGYRPEGALRDAAGTDATSEASASLMWTVLGGVACNDARLTSEDGVWSVAGDPTEGALLTLASKAGLDPDVSKRSLPRMTAIPFSSDRKYMATLNQDDAGRQLVFAKGAVERIVELCPTQMRADGSTSAIDREQVLAAADRLAVEGLRVLAFARAEADPGDDFTADSLPGRLTLTGLQAMLDPPRQAAIAAIAACHTAGIDVKMITGDHATTAAAIAEKLGIITDDGDHEVLTGIELAELDPSELPDAVERASVFARVSTRTEAAPRRGTPVPPSRGRHDRRRRQRRAGPPTGRHRCRHGTERNRGGKGGCRHGAHR